MIINMCKNGNRAHVAAAIKEYTVHHFRVALSLFLKARLSDKKMSF